MEQELVGATRSPKTWVFLVFGGERQYAGNLGYEDDLSRVYEYDSFVPNHLKLASGDVVILQGRQRILGYARVERIHSRSGTKQRRRCPECQTTAFKARTTKKPRYKCDRRHEFDIPLTEHVTCTLYTAHFGDSFTAATSPPNIDDLRRAYSSYNGQLAMQEVDTERLTGPSMSEVRRSVENLLRVRPEWLQPEDGELFFPDRPDTSFAGTQMDERERVMRQIRSRRGQATFRQELRKCFQNRCVVSGCTLVDVLEASHISPYRGNADHHLMNGLLLRADLHTLFDLDLMGIEPDSLTVRFHPDALLAGYDEFDGRLLECQSVRPDRAVLESRWAAFQRRLQKQ